MNYIDSLKEWINSNPGKAAGVAAGAVFGILVLTVGVVKTVLIMLFILLGYLIGKLKDDNISLKSLINDIFKRK